MALNIYAKRWLQRQCWIAHMHACVKIRDDEFTLKADFTQNTVRAMGSFNLHDHCSVTSRFVWASIIATEIRT